MGEFSIEKILVIGIFILIFFGAKKIPEMMRGLGKGVREFNDAKKGMINDFNDARSNAPEPAAPKAPQNTITDLEHEAVSSK